LCELADISRHPRCILVALVMRLLELLSKLASMLSTLGLATDVVLEPSRPPVYCPIVKSAQVVKSNSAQILGKLIPTTANTSMALSLMEAMLITGEDLDILWSRSQML
jgi:hypothetical protein